MSIAQLTGVFALCLLAATAARAEEGAAPPPPGQEASAARADEGRRLEWQAQVEASRQRQSAWLQCFLARRATCGDPQDPMDALLEDETLVAGDIVSTREGLKVFRGQPQVPHSRDDFK